MIERFDDFFAKWEFHPIVKGPRYDELGNCFLNITSSSNDARFGIPSSLVLQKTAAFAAQHRNSPFQVRCSQPHSTPYAGGVPCFGILSQGRLWSLLRNRSRRLKFKSIFAKKSCTEGIEGIQWDQAQRSQDRPSTMGHTDDSEDALHLPGHANHDTKFFTSEVLKEKSLIKLNTN